jgi:hypothetical protein
MSSLLYSRLNGRSYGLLFLATLWSKGSLHCTSRVLPVQYQHSSRSSRSSQVDQVDLKSSKECTIDSFNAPITYSTVPADYASTNMHNYSTHTAHSTQHTAHSSSRTSNKEQGTASCPSIGYSISPFNSQLFPSRCVSVRCH